MSTITKIAATAAIATFAATSAFAGGMAEPVMVMEPAMVMEDTAGTSGGLIIPLILIALIAAALSADGGSGPV